MVSPVSIGFTTKSFYSNILKGSPLVSKLLSKTFNLVQLRKLYEYPEVLDMVSFSMNLFTPQQLLPCISNANLSMTTRC